MTSHTYNKAGCKGQLTSLWVQGHISTTSPGALHGQKRAPTALVRRGSKAKGPTSAVALGGGHDTQGHLYFYYVLF